MVKAKADQQSLRAPVVSPLVFVKYQNTSGVCSTDYGGQRLAASQLRRVGIEIPSRKAGVQLESSSDRVRTSRNRKTIKFIQSYVEELRKILINLMTKGRFAKN